jgi:hypothetical protein
MRKLVIAVLLLSGMTAFGQSSHFGIKGGLNYGSTGELSGITDRPINGDNKVGYHLGLLGHLEFAGIFFQPELVYTRLTTEYSGRSLGGSSADYAFSKLDIPLLVGLEILGPLNIKAGPSFQVVLNNDLDDSNIDDPENTFTVGYQLGVGVSLGKLGLDLRYEGAFQDNNADSIVTASDVSSEGFTIDSRPSQWILSLSYAFGD